MINLFFTCFYLCFPLFCQKYGTAQKCKTSLHKIKNRKRVVSFTVLLRLGFISQYSTALHVYLRHVHIRIDIGREEGTQHVHRNKARSHVCRTPDRSQAPPEQ